MSMILADKVIQAFLDAGIITREDRVTRLVLDLQVRQAPRLYIERYGDERLLRVVPSLDGIQIDRVDSA